MKNFLFLLFFITPIAANAEECVFNYWELIPHNSKCEKFLLPDFTFDIKYDQTDGPFCRNYKILSKNEENIVGYCSTGRPPKLGPNFKVGGITYLADLNL